MVVSLTAVVVRGIDLPLVDRLAVAVRDVAVSLSSTVVIRRTDPSVVDRLAVAGRDVAVFLSFTVVVDWLTVALGDVAVLSVLLTFTVVVSRTDPPVVE